MLRLEDLKPPLNAVIIDCNEKLHLLKDFFNRNEEFCLDLETNVVNFYQDRVIRTISFGNRDEQYIIDLLKFTEGPVLNRNWGAYLKDVQGQFVCSPIFQKIYDVINPVLDSNKWLKVAYNGEFEYIALRWCLGIYTWNMFDCFLAEKVIYCGLVDFKIKGFWGLDNTVQRYLGVEISKVHQKSFDLVSPLTNGQIAYAALDCRLTMAVKAQQFRGFKSSIPLPKGFKGLEKEGLLEAVIIENNAIPAFGDMHINGILLDSVEWMERIEEVRQELKETIVELDEVLIPVVGRKDRITYNLEKLESDWRECKEKEERKKRLENLRSARREIKERDKLILVCLGEALLNYDSPAQLLEAVNKLLPERDRLPDTDDLTLKKKAGYPVIDLLRKFRGLNTIINRYAPYVNQINNKTSRVHANFIQLAAETGRPSSRNPNLFNIPKSQKWRKCFRARKGYKQITADHAGQELRILTEKSQEPVWVSAFRNNEDVHSRTAEKVFTEEWKKLAYPDCEYYKTGKKCKCVGHSEAFNKGTKNEKPCLRDKAKTVNFGVAYGAAEKKISEELGISKKEAKSFLIKYFSELNILAQYLQQAGDSAEETLESRTISGRRRLFKEVDYNNCVNKVMEDRKVDKKVRDNLEFRSIFKAKFIKAINRKWYALKGAIRREGVNTTIQGTGADMLKVAMGSGHDADGKPFLWHQLRNLPGYLQNSVYDELLVEVKEDFVDVVAPIIKDAMIRAGNRFVKSIPFDSDIHVEDFWTK